MFESLIIIFLIMIFVIYIKKYKANAIIIDAFDNNTYIVNDLPDSKNAADMLATIMTIINELINNIINNYVPQKSDKDDKYIKYITIIRNRLPKVKISENLMNNGYTSYSINKGEELVFCLRSRNTMMLHDINELLYVAIHEVAHIGCPEVGHTTFFKELNAYLLEKAICLNVYKYIDYGLINKEYCGMLLTNTILEKYPTCAKV